MVKGRDPSKTQNDRNIRAFRQYEGDIYLKHVNKEDSPDGSHIAIRDNSIGIHVRKGNVGIRVKGNGDILVQGKVVMKAYGDSIIKGPFSENPLSFIPSTLTTPIPQLLFRMPNVQLMLDMADKFSEFQKLFK